MQAKHSKAKKGARVRLNANLPSGHVDAAAVRLSAYLSPELARSTRIRAATENCTISALVADALAQHLRV